jgi:methylglutaconyl-CoA hydratase
LIKHLLAGGPEAHASIKTLIRSVAGRRPDDALVAETAQRIAEIRGSPEGREGIAAFLEKRKASWCSPKS